MSMPRIAPKTLLEVQRALAEYTREIDACEKRGMAPTTAKTYLLHATNFVRWLEGEFEPGARVKSL